MNKFKLLFSMLAFLLIGVVANAQYTTPQLLTLSGTDTITNGGTKSWTLPIGYSYYWSLSVYNNKLSGTTDSVKYELQESVDGTHFTDVVGAPTKTFTANGTYTWSGGNQGLPLIWPSGNMRILQTYLHACTGCSTRPYIYLELKPTKLSPY